MSDPTPRMQIPDRDRPGHNVVSINSPIDRNPEWGDVVVYSAILEARDYGDMSPITDDDLFGVYGPQWPQLIELFREAFVLTDEQRLSIYRAGNEAWQSEAFRTAWRAVGGYSGPGVAARRALGAVVVYVSDAGVASALARRHEITAEQYALLVAPWVSVTGRQVHPDDKALT